MDDIAHSPKTDVEIQHKNKFPIALLGVIFVLAVAVGAGVSFLKPQSSTSTKSPNASKKPTLKPLFVSLDRSQSNAVVINGEIFISGMTLPNIPVVMYSNLDAVSSQADNHGYFEDSLLVGNEDTQVTVSVYSETGEERSITIDVKSAPELSYVGMPQVLGNNTEAPGQLKKAGINAPTPKPRTREDFLSVRFPTPKPTKLGLIRMKNLLATEASQSSRVKNQFTIHPVRLTDASNSAQLRRRAVAGIITSIAEDHFMLAHLVKRSETTKVYINPSTAVSIKGVARATTDNLAIAMRVVAVGERSEDGLLAVFVHVIPGNAYGALERQPPATGSATQSTPTSTPVILPTATQILLPTTTPTELPTQ